MRLARMDRAGSNEGRSALATFPVAADLVGEGTARAKQAVFALASKILTYTKAVLHPRNGRLVVKFPRFHYLQRFGQIIVCRPEIEMTAARVDEGSKVITEGNDVSHFH